jgi:uncharacterized membrane protein YphA (DoxX/SURF4 family)
MSNEPSTRTALIPLLLRLTLAAVFIYTGVSYITGARNDWGTSWATNMWEQQMALPRVPLAELDREFRRLQAEEGDLTQAADGLEGTAKADNDKKLAENAIKQAEVLREQERMKAANVAANPLPEALSHPGVQLAVAWGELACGIAMLFGLFTRVAALGLIVIMGGAIYLVTGAQGFANPAGAGWDHNLLVLAICVVLMITGSGRLSLDACLAYRRKSAKQSQQQPVAV